MATKGKIPTPVKIVEAEKAIPVIVEDKKEKKKVYVDKDFKKSLAPDTTAEEDIVTRGQRKINLLWEITQALIALMITGAVIYQEIMKGAISKDLSNAFFLVVSMYLVRTNHQRTGGVPGPLKYTGR